MPNDIVTIRSELYGDIVCEREEHIVKRHGLPRTRWVATCDMEPFARATGNTPEEAAEALEEALA